MLHLIPAWYQQNNWCENEQKWYVRRVHTEFDDTVKHVQLFQRSKGYPYQILLLGFSPNFRHFLHRQGVYRAPYWSCFDAIQEIRRRKAVVLSFHNMKWPPGREFVYTMFAVTAMLAGEKYAQIEFGEDGNPIQIDIFREGRLYRRNFYDDRGFISGTVVYGSDGPLYQDYLMENGVWKMRCFQGDGHVEINPEWREYLLLYEGRECKMRFTKLSYDSLEQVIGEVLQAYLRMTKTQDLFCVAMHERHTELLGYALKGRHVILSFFEQRYLCREHPETSALLGMAGCIVTDSRENSKQIRELTGDGDAPKRITDISPYDSRVDFGVSRQLEVQKILVPVDGMPDEVFDRLVETLGRYLTVNGKAMVHLFTRVADYDRKGRLLEQVRRCLRSTGYEEDWAAETEDRFVAENDLEREQAAPARFFVEQCVDELSVSKCMREQRILVDLRDVPELFVQITALSVGIPQIVHRKTQFVEHKRNGFLLRRLDRLPAVLEYYLGSMKNWNDAMVSAYELGKEFTTEVLLEKWRGVIDFFGEDTDFAARRSGLE